MEETTPVLTDPPQAEPEKIPLHELPESLGSLSYPTPTSNKDQPEVVTDATLNAKEAVDPENPKKPLGNWPRRTADSYSNIGGKSKNKKARKTFAAKNDEPEGSVAYGTILEAGHVNHTNPSNPIIESRKTGPCVRVRFGHLSLAIMPDGDLVSIQYKRPNTALNVYRSMSKKKAVKSVMTIVASREFPDEISLAMKSKGFSPSVVERTNLDEKGITGKKALQKELLYYLEFV